MDCSIFSRLFRHRPLTRLHSTNPSTPPSAPATPSSIVLGTRPATSNLNPDDNTDPSTAHPIQLSDDIYDNRLLLNTMAGQGPPLLSVRSVDFDPATPFADIAPPFRNSEGYLGLRIVPRGPDPDGHTLHDWVYTFSTAADASNVLLNHPQVTIGGRQYSLFPYDGDFGEPQFDLSEPGRTRDSLALPPSPPSDISPPRKRLKKSPPPTKIVCKFCLSDIDGIYSTPCRRCKEATCYQCLKTYFMTALENIDRMPVRCCHTVMHHEVAQGILPAAELEKYKQKYDEFNTVDPLYCPVPTCSAFIPPRMFKQTDRIVMCHVCKTTICTKCKQHAGDEHTCAKDDPRQFILKTFEYKLCPKCGTGVMKMYGCPHLRCQCGAHWCWDCQRPMNACYQKPCRAARGDGVHSEGGDDEPESDDDEDANEASTSALVPTESEVNLQAQATQNHALLCSDTNAHDQTQDTAADQAAESTEAESIQNNEIETQPPATDQPTSEPPGPEATPNGPGNLDDPEEIDWEGVSMDFGDEPTDETWDTWGCRHQFSDFGKDNIPEFWLVDMNTAKDVTLEVECMGCFSKVKVGEGETKKTGFREKWCHWKPSRLTEPSASEARTAVGSRTRGSGSKSQASFECRLCGVIYCGLCKKAARKRISRERATSDI